MHWILLSQGMSLVFPGSSGSYVLDMLACRKKSERMCWLVRQWSANEYPWILPLSWLPSLSGLITTVWLRLPTPWTLWERRAVSVVMAGDATFVVQQKGNLPAADWDYQPTHAQKVIGDEVITAMDVCRLWRWRLKTQVRQVRSQESPELYWKIGKKLEK